MQQNCFQRIRKQLTCRLFEDQKPRRNSILSQTQVKNPQKSQTPESQPVQDLASSQTRQEKQLTFPPSVKRISLSFDDEWECHDYIGQGCHAVVKKCYKRTTELSPTSRNRPKECAVKIFRTGDPEIVNTIKETFNLNRILSESKNIIRAYDLYIDENKQVIHMVMEYCNFQNLERLIQKRQLIRPLVQDILEQMAISVEFMHSKGIAHRDLKPDNILVNITVLNQVELKIIDFGVSKKFIKKSPPYTCDMWTRTGTIFYQAPEIFEGGGYDQQVDMWSIGVMLYQMLCGKLPYQCDTIIDTITMITEETDCYEFDDAFQDLNHLEQDLIKRLLKKNPSKRLSATELKLHPWLQSSQSSSPIHQIKCKDDSSVVHRMMPDDTIDMNQSSFIDRTQSTYICQLQSHFSQKQYDEIKVPELEEQENLMKQWDSHDFTDHIHYVKKERVDLKTLSSLKLKKITSDQNQGTSQELKFSSLMSSPSASPNNEALLMQFFYEEHHLRSESQDFTQAQTLKSNETS